MTPQNFAKNRLESIRNKSIQIDFIKDGQGFVEGKSAFESTLTVTMTKIRNLKIFLEEFNFSMETSVLR